MTDRVGRVCMLSTHGYVDPIPQLGRTDTGGQVVYVLELSKALSRLGHRVDIYTRGFERSKPPVDPVPDHPGVRVVRIPAGPWEFIPKEQIYGVLPELAANMVEFIREQRLDYDLFHGHYVDAGIVTLEVASALERPAFFTAHSLGAWKREQMGGDPEEMERRFNFNHRTAEELRIFRSVRAQTVTTEVQRDKIKELYGHRAENIHVIPPGVDVDLFRSLGPDEQEGETGLPTPYILCLSRIDTNKGHDLLLHAFDLVRRAVPAVHLVIAGGSPQPESREQGVLDMIDAIIDQKDLRNLVRHIPGHVDRRTLASYYRRAALFVLPSLFEPFGMTALEAMACNTPVVASRLGGIRNVIESGVNGLLVDPSDTEELAGAMIHLLSEPNFSRRIGSAGRETVRERFSWEAIARRHLELYDGYLNSRG